MALLHTDLNFPALTKINFYTVPCKSTDYRYYLNNQIFESSVTFKTIVEKVRTIIQSQEEHIKDRPTILPRLGNLEAIKPIQITIVDDLVNLLLVNGMILVLKVDAKYEVSVEDIVLSPIYESIKIRKHIKSHYDERDVGHFGENQDFAGLNPIFPQSSGFSRFTGDTESVDHFKCCKTTEVHT